MPEDGPNPGGQGSGTPPDYEGATDAVFGGPDQAELDLRAQEAQVAFHRRIGRDISHIFERVTGGVRLKAQEASHLASNIVSRAANVKVFGQNLTSGLDYVLHHKTEIVTGAVQYALTHKAEIVTGAVVGGLGKAAVRGVLTGTGGFLVAAGAGAVGGGLAGAVKEYGKQREKISIDKAEGTLIIAGLRNEFRRIKGANKERIRNAAIRGAITGAVAGIVGAEIADNPWVQEHILSKIRLPEIKLPEVKLPSAPPPSVPVVHAPEFPAPEPISPAVSPTEVTAVAAAPTVEPAATPAPAAPAVPTAEATPIPTKTPTPLPTGTPTSELAPAPAVQPPAAPEPPAGPSRILHPTAPTGAPELAAAPAPAAPTEISPAAPPTPPVTTEPAAPVLPAEPAVAPPEAPAAPPAELAALPEQVPLPAGSNPWEVTSRTLRDILGRDPTNAEILQVTKEVCRQSNIAVPNWEITGEVDQRALPVNYKLVFNDPVKKLIAGMKG